ncbi:MAG: Gfo/Idh/MocA family oxidoreductase [Acidobacteria bacterium]|nr:Gfo/Idh/MocA family oxidoreductase [Acidobacteriota bacterium]
MPSGTARRTFLKTAGGGALAAQSGRVLGANDEIRLGAIGAGGRCRLLMEYLNKMPGTRMVAVCDVYEPRRLQAAALYSPAAEALSDYRALLDRKDIDAVVIASPDHWHARMMIDAVSAGKDVYLEKPITHALEEGPPMIEAIRRTGRIVQTGTQQRSWEHYQKGKEIIASGKLGKITMVHAYWYQNYAAWRRGPRPAVDTSKLDWKAWLGSAPEQPFVLDRFTTWRWYWDFGGGALTDLLTHWIDVIHWYMGKDAPASAMTSAHHRFFKQWDCPDTISAYYDFPGDFSVVYNGTMTSSIDYGGIEFRGQNATLKIDRAKLIVYSEDEPRSDSSPTLPQPELMVPSKGDGTIDHLKNFLECVRTRRQPTAPVEVGVAAARTSHLGNLSLRQGRRVSFDPETGRVS